MPYGVGDATPGANEYGIEPLDSPSLGLKDLSWVGSQARPKDAYDTYWRQAAQVVASQPPAPFERDQYRLPASPASGMSSYGFEALQLGPGGPDTVKGGLSLPNLASALDPTKYSAMTPAPPLAPGVQPTALGKAGQLTLDLIHPFTSFAQATGPYINPIPGAAPLFGFGAMGQKGGTGIDPMAFLAERNVELLGNAPSRALDYLLAPFNVAARHLLGQPGGPATNGEGLVKYAFQKDPNYWQWIGSTDETYMGQQAKAVADAYAPGYQNQGLQAQLLEQFRKDQNVMLGLSSGDEAIDYRAKQSLATLLAYQDHSPGAAAMNLPDGIQRFAHAGAMTFPAIPVIGTQLGQLLDPVAPATEAAWLKLTPQERGTLLQNAGFQQMFGSMIVTLPAFSGLGAVAAFGARAAEAGTFAGTAYRFYSTGLDVLTQAMKAGVGVALSNWAAEIAIPGYTDLLGREIDEARPVSDSVVGGAVNLLGYFAAPGDVLGPYLGLVTKPIRGAIGGGLKAIPIYKTGFGGVEMDAHVARAYTGPELSATAFATDARRVTLSEMMATELEDRRLMWEDAIAKGDPGGNFPVDVVTRDGRIAHARDDLMAMPRSIGTAIEAKIQIIEKSKKPLGWWATAADRADHAALKVIAQAIEGRAEQRYVSQYGPGFWSHTLSRGGLAYSVDGFKGWLQAQAERQGWTVDMPSLAKHLGNDLERWQTLARKMYQREFDHNNGLLQAAAEGAAEAGRVMLARQTHLFRADAVNLRQLIEADPVAARGAAWQAIQRTEELATWWAKEKPGKGGGKGIDDIRMNRLARQLDQLIPMVMAKRELPPAGRATETLPLNALHAKIENEGHWTVAYKPQYARAEGDMLAPAADGQAIEPTFVSYSHVGEGEFLQSPYLDYPMESADLIRTGGEGYLASKLDNMTRAFRSWRIGQFQQGLMYRAVTRYDGVTGAQAGEFFDQVQSLAAAKIFGPKAVGIHLSPQAAAAAFHSEVQAIGERVFGREPLRNADTGRMETPQWDEIARRSFAQSAKLNLTAGVTSRFKQMGAAGDLAIWAGDIIVPVLRFGLSPVFRIGEYVESKMLNVMRMGPSHIDPLARPLYVRGGLTRERAMMRSEMSADPMANALLPGDLTATRRTSAAGFLTPTRSGRPAPMEAANAERAVPGIDMPNGPEAPARPVTPADSTLGEYQAAMADVFRMRDAEAQLTGVPEGKRPQRIVPGLSTEEFRARARANITAINDRAEEIAALADAVEWPSRIWDGGKIIVSRDSGGGWRATSFTDKGEPVSHFEARSMQEAIQEISRGGLADVYRAPSGVIRHDGTEIRPVDPAAMRAAEARYEAARESLLAQYGAPWQEQVAAYRARMDEFWTRHGQPAQPIRNDVGAIAELRAAQRERAAAEAQLVANPDDFAAMESLFAASDREAVAAETLRHEGPQPATDLRDMPGQPEHFEAKMDEAIAAQPSGLRRQLEEIWSPQSMKERAAHDLTIRLFRDIFPAALKASGSRVAALLRDELHVPEGEWVRFMLEDKIRLQAVQDSGGAPEAWQKLFAHSDKYRQGASDMAGAELDALYQTPEWNVVSSLWLAAEQAARDESFGVHFFAKYRSAFARSVNHPLIGVYPAAWAFKAAKEWFRFLYDNHAFGDGALRLGMTPAVAIAHIEDQQNRLMALTGSSMDDLIGFGGPLSSAIFMFNLLLPGDWSSLPFPFARSIRMAMRGDIDIGHHIQMNTVGDKRAGGIGVMRDVRMANEAAGEILSVLGHVRSPGEVDFSKIGAVLSRDGLPPRPKNWRQLGSYPTQ